MRIELTNNIIGAYTLSQVSPRKFGQINDSVGFSKVDGQIRQLTLRDRLQQIVNLGQPSVIARESYSVSEAKIALERYNEYYLDAEVGNH